MARKIKVLHIIKTLSLGGAETNLLNLATAFDSGRVETHVAYSFGGEIEDRFHAAGARLFKYADGNYRIKSLNTIPIVLRLAQYIRKQGIDVVHTHNFNGHVWGLLAAKMAGAKVVEHVHDFRYTPAGELARRHGLLAQYKFIKYFRNQSDCIIVLTHDHAQYVVEQGIAPMGRVTELQNGIPMNDAEAPHAGDLRQKLGIPAEAVVILTSARMDPVKNIDLILAIAPRLLKFAPQCIFVVAGSGSRLQEYKDRAQRAGLASHVRFIGFVQDMYSLLTAADVFLLPSFLELHSIAILEALKMKLPVVVSQGVGCHDEFIQNGVNGLLCDPFAEEPWIRGLAQLAGDPALRKTMGLRGHETCRRLFNIEDTAARVEKIYAGLVA